MVSTKQSMNAPQSCPALAPSVQALLNFPDHVNSHHLRSTLGNSLEQYATSFPPSHRRRSANMVASAASGAAPQRSSSSRPQSSPAPRPGRSHARATRAPTAAAAAAVPRIHGSAGRRRRWRWRGGRAGAVQLPGRVHRGRRRPRLARPAERAAGPAKRGRQAEAQLVETTGSRCCCVAFSGIIRFLCMWALTAVSSLAMCACLAVSVFPGLSILVPRLASRVTLAVRADARDVIYLSIYLRGI